MRLLNKSEVNFQWDDIKAHDIRFPSSSAQRSAGVHVSDILKYLYFGSLPPAADKNKEMKIAGEELEVADLTIMPLRMIMGMGWESHLMGFLPGLNWQPGEVRKDGVSGSPDAEEEEVNKLHEIKLTWKSCRERNEGQNILNEVLWMWQIKSYLYLKGWNEACLHVGWINGDYRHPYQPRYFKYELGADKQELEDFWRRAILPNKEKALAWNKEQQK